MFGPRVWTQQADVDLKVCFPDASTACERSVQPLVDRALDHPLSGQADTAAQTHPVTDRTTSVHLFWNAASFCSTPFNGVTEPR